MPTRLDPVISPATLAERLSAPDLRVIDATWRPAGENVDGRALHLAERIPGAVFFDIDEIADRDVDLPHMLPSAEKFSSRMRRMGIGDGASIVVYDSLGMFSAARVWWTFRVMGKEDVQVLDGGLPAWKAAGLPLEDGPPVKPQERHFTTRRRADLVRTLADMRRIVADRSAQILDARGSGRFAGAEPEPRPGLRGGHMPGARNLPYSLVLTSEGLLKPAVELEAALAQAGIDPSKPIVTTCGSGVTAALLALALARLGRWDVPVYDGSWAEWGALPDTPVETG